MALYQITGIGSTGPYNSTAPLYHPGGGFAPLSMNANGPQANGSPTYVPSQSGSGTSGSLATGGSGGGSTTPTTRQYPRSPLDTPHGGTNTNIPVNPQWVQNYQPTTYTPYYSRQDFSRDYGQRSAQLHRLGINPSQSMFNDLYSRAGIPGQLGMEPTQAQRPGWLEPPPSGGFIPRPNPAPMK